MKLKIYSTAALMAIMAMASCAGDENKDFVDKTVVPTGQDKAATVENAMANPTVQNTGAIPAALQPANVQQPAVMQQPGSTITMPGGKTVTVPGGGPIAITPNAGQPNTTPQNVMMTQTPAAVQPTAPGMNPPHGQPGHRCDISVGAPLNSKPVTPAATTPGATASAQPQVTMTEVANKTKTAPGMNPPHGEPNHRCDIAVGAPLNSKPAPVTTPAATTVAPPALLTSPKADSSKN